MATPDPFMDDLQIMSYASRPLACKDLYKVPRRKDFIELLWCLDGLPGLPEKWYPAEVLHTSRGPDQDSSECLAKGVLLYLPVETWNEQIDEVEFLDGQSLRCVAKHESDNEEINYEHSGQNSNPTLRWRFQLEPSKAEEEEWEPSHNGEKLSSAINAPIGVQTQHHNSRFFIDVEMRALRDGHASLTVEVEKLKRELVIVTNHIHSLRYQDTSHRKCRDANCVLPRLRQKLPLRMQASHKQFSICLWKRKNNVPDQDHYFETVDGIHSGVIRVCVDCSLDQFESLSMQIRTLDPKKTVLFFPDFAYTQLPSDCSTDFRVVFQTFSQLCEVIGVMSATDKKEMARRCGKSVLGDLLRMLGTYEFNKENVQSPATFYPGTSCGASNSVPISYRGHSDIIHAERLSADEDRRADQIFPVLTRKNREWNKVDGRFVRKMRSYRTKLPILDEDCSHTQAFALNWKRAGDITGKGWSNSLTDAGEVFGWLEVCLPFVQTQGGRRCREFGALANDDLWDNLFRISSKQ